MSCKVFVIGKSRVGKTTFSKKFAAKFGFQHIQASEWIKDQNKDLNPDAENYRVEVTKRSIQALRKNQNSCVDFIKQKYDLTLPTLIEGVRNPHDFHNLCDYQNDYVILLNHPAVEKEYPLFDSGVDAIRGSVGFLLLTNIMLETHIISESFHVLDTIYNQAQKAVDYYEMTDQNDLYRLS